MSDPIRVLHVDDEPDFADMAAAFVKREDERFRVDTAESTEEGLERLAGAEYDCIVSDYDMPGRNGIEFLETVREIDSDLPFILFTGKGSEEIASDAISAGVTDYIQKEAGTSHYTVLANRVGNAVEQRRSERALQRSRRRLSLFFEESPLGVIEWNDRFEAERLNDTAEEILGYTEAELVGEPWEVLVPEVDRQDVETVVSELLETEGGYTSVNENVRKDGERIVCEWHNRVVTDDGDVVAIFSQFQDVTAREERKAELRRRERRFQAVFNDPNILVGQIDTDGTVVDINRTAMEYVDATKEEITGVPFWGTPWFEHSGAVRASVRDWIDRAASGEYVDFEVELVRPNGEPYVIEGVFRPVTDDDGEVVSLLITDRDVTERVERERELEEYRRYTDDTLDAIDDLFFVHDQAGNLRRWNRSFTEVIGYSDEELESMTGADFVPPGDRDRTTAAIEQVFEEGHARLEAPLLTKDGSTVPYEYVASRVTHPNGEPRLVGIGRDISKRTEHERELRETNRQLQAVLDTVDAAIFIKDTEGRYQLMNQECRRLLGVDPGDDVDGLTDGDLLPDEVAEQYRSDDRRVLENEETITVEERVPAPGDAQTHLTRKSPFYDEDGDLLGVCAVSTDITDRKEQTERIQRQKDRLEEFASVVSHDLRNPLQVAEGRLNLAVEECDNRHLDAVADALDRMDDIVEDVLWLAREGRVIGETDPVDLAGVAEAAWSTVVEEGAASELRVAETERDTGTIIADRDRLRQLLENLFRNSVEHAGPAVTVRIVPVDGGFAVEDDGPGIPPDRREEVFETGYTTAESGTGFGLSIVSDIADAHGWDVRPAESESGGARVEFVDVETAAP